VFWQNKIQWQLIGCRKATVRYCLRRKTSENVPGNVANVGRNDPADRLNVNDWNRDNGNDNVFAVPVIVSRKYVFKG